MIRPLLPFLAALAAAPLGAQSADFEFSIRNIMRGPEVYGRTPEMVRWTPDGAWIYFRWLPPGTAWHAPLEPYRVRARAGARPERVTEMHMDSVAPLLAAGDETARRRLRAVEHEGDLWLIDLRTGRARRLTDTRAAERSPEFSADERHVFFVRDDNVFSIELATGLVRQHTDVRSGEMEKEEKEAEGQRGVLERQQRELFESIRDRLRADSIEKARKARRDSTRVRPLYLRKQEEVDEVAVAPSGRALLIATEMATDSALRTKVPEFVTTSGYTEERTVRTKVGDAQPSGRVAFTRLPDGELRWLQLIAGDSTAIPASVNLVGWNDAGTMALVVTTARDYKARYLHLVTATGELRTLDTLRDTAWVNGPCNGCAGWYDEGRRVWFVSEADGYAHLYTTAADGSDRRQLTEGEWEVLDVELSPDRREFRLHTSRESPFERHFYRLPTGGGTLVRITERTGGHTVTVSPDGRLLADVFSTANRPPELFLMDYRPGAAMHQLTTSPTAAWLSHRWIIPEIVRIPASDGVQVPARIYRPQDVGAQPNGAGVIFVHGAGYLHNVHNYWSSYAREYMFNQFLAAQGYVVLDIDYRASAGYGRDWRTAIYRHMGGRDLQDQVDGARYLRDTFGIDPERIGIYGGSYGGFITLMALFTEAEWFGAGAALRSVTDWAHYNHPYTARILNRPDADSVAFRRSSPIYFAEGLEDPLLIAHGMVDVNVHFQDVVRLAQRLIELGKTGWEMAVYPVEDHAFVRPSSWTDEYRRIYELFERALHPVEARAADGSR